METLIETVDLDLEENNELAFKIKVEGTSTSPAKVRLVCEGTDVSYMFNGYGTGEDSVVQFVIPQMKDKLSEGTYQARVEVLIENRYFSPVQFQVNFKKALKVVAEAIQFAPRPSKSEIKVSASPVVISKPVIQPIIEQKPVPVIVEQKKVEEVPIVTKLIQEPIIETQIASSALTLKKRYEEKKLQKK